MKKRIFSILLSIAVIIAMMPANAFAATSDGTDKVTTFKVASAAELEKALNKGINADIIITEDFSIDRTFYVSAPTTIRTTEKHTLTRKSSFTGDIFVVGQDKSGKDMTLEGVDVKLNLGDPKSTEKDMLVIDGNRDNMIRVLKVNGTALFLCYMAQVNIYAGASIVNCYKETNKRTIENDYAVSYPSRIGGAMAVIASGTLNIYGGTFKNNSTNDEDETLTAEDADYRLSSQGGAIYNFGNLKIYGGDFIGNHAARGGVVYNYKKTKIYGGNFEGNTATRYAGVAYCPDSQYSNLIMGGSEEAAAKCEGGKCNITFKENSAVSTGGAIFGQTKSGIVIYDDANVTFEKNRTERFNGGAIATSGALTIKGGAEFKNNDANSKGGAIYLSNSKEELVTRKPALNNAVFEGNTAARGGAIALTAKAAEFKEGGIATFTGCIFDGNKAVAGKKAFDSATEKFADAEDINTNGGALYISRKSTLTVDDCDFSNNVAELKEGGAIYQTAQSPITIKNSTFTGNECPDAAEGCGGAITDHGSLLNISGTVFEGNETERHGAAIYLSYKNLEDGSAVHSIARVNDCTFKDNVSHYHGGGIYVTSREDYEKDEATYLRLTGSSFAGNSAVNNGGGVYFTKSAGYLENNSFTENHASARASEDTGKRYGGAAIYGTNSSININGAELKGNNSDFNGGAVEVHTGTDLVTNNVVAENNTALNHGGAMYVNKSTWTDYDGKYDNNHSGTYGGGLAVFTDSEASLFRTESCNNVADNKGGGIYFFGGSDSYLKDVKVNNNKALGTETSSGGGGVYITGTQTTDTGSEVVGSNLEINGGSINGNSAYKGGAVAAFSSAQFVMNNVSMKENTADVQSDSKGGAIYSSSGDFDLFNCSFEKNSSNHYGGAVAVPSNPAQAGLYGCDFVENKTLGSGTNGGAIWFFSEEGTNDFGEKEKGNAIVHGCTFTGNEATEYGGSISIQNGTSMQIYDTTAKNNKAGKYGGFLYASSVGTEAVVNGLTVEGNEAVSDSTAPGHNIYSGGNPVFSINKANIHDLDNPDSEMTPPAWVIEGEGKLIETTDEIPAAKKYEQKGKDSEYVEPADRKDPGYQEPEDADQYIAPKENSSVDTIIFKLAEGKPANSTISSTYNKLPKVNNTTNFQSRGITTFKNINGKTVTVDSFVLQPGDKADNTIYPVGLMIYQAMDYKRAHPEKNVRVDVSTFRFSVETAVCLNRDSKYFGYMRNLIGKNYDKNGFVRISYLLVEAAKMGIDVNVIGQYEGEPKDSQDAGFDEFFRSHLKDACDPKYVSDSSQVVEDFMDYHYCEWTSYDNLPASDMMHTKICAVSNYRDKDGKDHGKAIWLGSANLDGIKETGLSGRNRIQTAVLVANHDELYRVALNYFDLIAEYCGQEDIKDFREVVVNRNESQTKALAAGKAVDKDKQIVYTGTKDDSVFELYFAPFGGDLATWDELNNPFCKFVKKMRKSDGYILFTWTNVKYVQVSYQLARTLNNMINESFTKNKNPKNRIFVQARVVKDGAVHAFDGTAVKNLKIGKDIGFVSINDKLFGSVHSKDMQLSYSENGKRQYVSVINSINFHQGASFYQSNHVIVIKETKGTKGSVFYNIAKYTTNGIVSTDISKIKPALSNKTYTYDGKSKKPTVSAKASSLDYSITYDKNCKTVGKHKVVLKGKGIGTGTATLYYTINPKGTSVSKLTKAKKAFTVKWKKQSAKMSSSRITGYQICYSTSSSFKTYKSLYVKGYSKTSKKISKLSAKKKYYVKIRTYKTVNGTKYYSPWSKVKTVTTK